MTAEVSFNGQRVVSGSVEVPTYGSWAADVSLATDAQVASSGPLVIGNLSMQGFAYRQFAFAGTRKLRLVGGFAGGWMQSVPAQQYQSQVGLQLSLVLGDLVKANGEQVKVVTDATFGTFFFRKGTGPSKHVLDQLVGATWWVDPVSGIAQVGATHNAATISSAFTVIEYDGATGRAVIATEDPASWLPGRTWTAPTVIATQTIGSTRHSIVDGKLRTEVLSNSPETDPVIGPLRAMIQDLAPDSTYSGVWEYAVQATDGTTVDCSPTATAVLSAAFPLPQHVTKVPMRSGVAGTACKPAIGSVVYLAFPNGDPSKAIIMGFDTETAQSITMQAGSEGAARKGDSVDGGFLVFNSTGTSTIQYFPAGSIGAAAATAYAATLTPPGTILSLSPGAITGGSSTVTIG